MYAKRHQENEARVRVFCMTDDKEDKTLEGQEHFREVAKSRDVEVRQTLCSCWSYCQFSLKIYLIGSGGQVSLPGMRRQLGPGDQERRAALDAIPCIQREQV